MTDEELKAIEARQHTAHFSIERVQCIDVDLPALIADVRRLRGVIKDCNVYGWCAWCRQTERDPDKHDADCPAFTADGTVR